MRLDADDADQTIGDGQARWYVSSLARGLRIIAAFGPDAPAMSASDAARRTGMSRAAARRFLMTLEALGYVGVDERQDYVLRPKALELGYAFLSSLSVEQLVMPVLRELMRQTSETTNLAMRDGADIVYVARSVAYRPLHMTIQTGDRLPAYATSLGRVMLAALPPAELDAYLAATELRSLTPHTCTDPAALRRILDAVSRQGHALVADEIAIGIVSIAAPVRDGSGKVVAAINISSQSGRWNGPEMVHAFREPLVMAAEALGPAMQHGAFTQSRPIQEGTRND